jgi:hypothetical protein
MAFAEKDILKAMKNLGLTREEAIQMLQDDEDDVTVELTPEQKKVVKQMTQGDRKKETAPRKRVRKADDNKRHLMSLIEIAIGHNPSVEDFEITNPEREVMFTFKGEKYSLTLMKKRPPKD